MGPRVGQVTVGRVSPLFLAARQGAQNLEAGFMGRGAVSRSGGNSAYHCSSCELWEDAMPSKEMLHYAGMVSGEEHSGLGLGGD